MGFDKSSPSSVTNSRDTEKGSWWADPSPDSPFSNRSIRQRFVQKVYTILTLQLFYTTVFTSIILLYKPLRDYLEENKYVILALFIGGLILYMVCSCVITCCSTTAGRMFPLNYILLALTTIGLSAVVAVVCLHYKLGSVLLAVVIAGITCLTVSLLSCYTSFDITSWWWVIFLAGMAFSLSWFLYFVLVITIPSLNIPVLQMVFASIGLVISMVYLAFWTQMVVGGRKLEISPEDYVLASLMLYLEIINIFLYILQLIGQQS